MQPATVGVVQGPLAVEFDAGHGGLDPRDEVLVDDVERCRISHVLEPEPLGERRREGGEACGKASDRRTSGPVRTSVTGDR